MLKKGQGRSARRENRYLRGVKVIKVTQALEGLKILDLTRYAPGPFCTMILGDLGADIIKVEEVGSLTGRRAEQMQGMDTIPLPSEFASPESPYNPLNRNKRSIQLNLKVAMGQRIFYQMAERVDVVVEGFRPGVTKRLGIDYPTLKKINQRLVYCAITGYGQDGPYRDLPGHDINYIANAGAVGAMSLPGTCPLVPGNLIGDMAAGGMQAAIGILAALAARERTGRGQFVDIAMTDGAVSMLCLYLSRYFQLGTLPEPEERASCGAAHYYNHYQTSDGKFISIACSEPWFFANLCRTLGCEDFIPYQTDSQKTDEIKTYFEKKFLTRNSDEWFDILSKADVPVSRVLALSELAEDPQLRHRQMIVEVDHPGEGRIRQAGISIKLSETPGEIRNLGASPGESTIEILSELGYSLEDIKKLQEAKAVGTSRG
jgi:crotonobetainyl-CoA:carnitine CoA-transferase CaiB-like acyl-CoA transferase